jgi:hypothetical protein
MMRILSSYKAFKLLKEKSFKCIHPKNAVNSPSKSVNLQFNSIIKEGIE